MGRANTSSGTASFTNGINNTASGGSSVALGLGAIATGANAFAAGNNPIASATNTAAIGYDVGATAEYAVVIGSESIASGNKSSALGSGLRSLSYRETAVGSFNETYVPNSTNSWNVSDRVFSVGNGSSDANRSNAFTILKNGNSGFGTTTPDTTLHVVGKMKYEDGTQGNGYVLTSDADGNASWTAPETATILADADNDTKIQVEESTDEDIIRFDLAGTEKWIMKQSRLEPANTGNSVFIGENAGSADDLSDNYNIAIGTSALRNNSSGSANLAIGDFTGYNNSSGKNNIYLGQHAGSYQTTGQKNIILGIYSAGNSPARSFNENVLIGYEAGYNVAGDANVFLGYKAGHEETGSNKLYIENTNADSANALIYGEFDNNLLAINGTLRVNDGTQANGYVLTSDASGNSRWEDPAAVVSAEAWSLTGNSGIPGSSFIGTTDGVALNFKVNNQNAGRIDFDDFKGNAFYGYAAGTANGSGVNNAAFGYNTFTYNTSGYDNVAIGRAALYSNTTGNYNSASGFHALYHNTTGGSNTALGYKAGFNAAGSGNVFLGSNAGYNETGANKLYIENSNADSAHALIYGEFDSNILAVNGTLRVNDGTQANGYVLTSDASGNAGWAAAQTDNLGNHTATQNIQLGSHYLSGDGGNEGLQIDNSGNGSFSGALNVYGTLNKIGSDNQQAIQLIANAPANYVQIDVGGSGHSSDAIYIGDVSQVANEVIMMGKVGMGTVIASNSPNALEVNGNAAKPGGGSWSALSDRRMKQEIKPYHDGLNTIMQIKPVTYHYNDASGYNTEPEYVGVIAQELKEIAPYMVGSFEKNDVEYYDVDNSAMTYMLINAVKEQQEQIENMQVQIEALQAENEKLSAQSERMDDLESMLKELQSRITSTSNSLSNKE